MLFQLDSVYFVQPQWLMERRLSVFLSMYEAIKVLQFQMHALYMYMYMYIHVQRNLCIMYKGHVTLSSFCP